jgi:heme exporter protein A
MHAVSPPFLEIVALSCERDRRPLFENLNFSLDAGQMLQVKGPNGSGKTTLLRMLAGLGQPHGGEIRLKGRILGDRGAGLGREVLWIGHAAAIKGLLSAEENLAGLCALHQPESRAQIGRALAAVGLQGFEDIPCHRLSAGQQRRVALARLHLSAPPLWLLDEPFTALDKQAVIELEAHLAEHCLQGGLVILTTHHALGKMPCGYRDLDLGQHRR